MSSGIPPDYAAATKLDADTNSMLALAAHVWQSLSKAQRKAFADTAITDGGFKFQFDAHSSTMNTREHPS